jgi:tetratricopeptide (TPR) repeat protein
VSRWWLALVLGCAQPVPPVPVTDVWLAGCDDWVAGHCALAEPRELAVWATADREAEVVLGVGRERSATTWQIAREVHRGAIRVAPGDTLVVGSWTHAVVPVPDGEGPYERGLRLSDRARAEPAIADALLDDSIAAFGEAGAVKSQMRDVLLQVHRRLLDGRTDGLRDTLRALEPQLPREGETRYWWTWAVGSLDKRVGRLGPAADAFEELETLAALMGQPRTLADARTELANVYQLAGRHAAALAQHARIVDTPVEEGAYCARARYLNNLAWARLVAQERGVALEGDTLALLDEAESAMRADCKTGSALSAHLRINRAVALVDRDGAAALVALDGLDTRALDTEQQLAVDSVRARASLQLGRSEEAAAAYGALVERARGAGRTAEVWQAMEGQARALATGGAIDEALSRYAEADALAVGHASFVPMTLGRDAFLAERHHVARERVALLLGEGRVAEAFTAVRALRAAFLGSLWQSRQLDALDGAAQARWDAAVDAYTAQRREREALAGTAWKVRGEAAAAHRQTMARVEASAQRMLDEGLPFRGTLATLRDPADGELMLTWFEDAQGLVAFAATPASVRAVRVSVDEAATPEELSDALLTPFAVEIATASQVTLLPYGWTRDIDLHALPWQDGVLHDAVPVRWSLDLGPRPPRSVARMLVVADPRGDLPSARAEGEAVRGALGAPTVLSGSAATHDALLAALPEADLFHYAGHGAFGDEIFDGELLLAREGRLSVADILSLPTVPVRVVLSGCETARTRRMVLENLGLAQAFVTSGSSVAVASTRKVDDALAEAFVRALYDAGFATGDPVLAFQRAHVQTRRALPDADVGAFRLLVR